MFCNDFLLKQTEYCLSGLVVMSGRKISLEYKDLQS